MKFRFGKGPDFGFPPFRQPSTGQSSVIVSYYTAMRRFFTFFLFVLLVQGPLVLFGCRGPGNNSGPTPGSDSTDGNGNAENDLSDRNLELFRHERASYNPKKTRKDQEIQKLIRRLSGEDVTPLKRLRKRQEVINFVNRLSDRLIEKKVTSTGKNLAGMLTMENPDLRSALGNWYVLRGFPLMPASVDELQERWKGNKETSLYNVFLRNPTGFDDPKESSYYMVILPRNFPREYAGEKVFKMNGILWDFWSFEETDREGISETPQKFLPVFIVKDFQVIGDWSP